MRTGPVALFPRRSSALAVLLLLAAVQARGQWNVAHFGTNQLTNPFEVQVGKARNDGTNRLYYAEFHDRGGLREVTWTGTAWNNSTIDQNRRSLNIFIGPGRNDGVARLYTPNYAGKEMLEITSTNPLIYATPRQDLALGINVPTANEVILQLTNLTAQCAYRIEVTPDLTQPLSNAASFTASSPCATWSNHVESSREFYRARGLPQEEP